MGENTIVDLVESQDWLEPIQEKGGALVNEVFSNAGEAGQAAKNFLHGVWLGHPLHSAITDVPVGSWTAALVMDVLEMSGRSEYAPGADAAIALGLVGAVGAAASGLADWSDTHGKAQRVGALHGLINAGAAILYGGSYVARKADNRGLGRGLSFAGYAMVIAGAFLGGEVAYSKKIGVNHAPLEEDLPKQFTPVCAVTDLEENTPLRRTADGNDIFLLKRGSSVFALANKCAHLGGPLNEGKIEGDVVQCPWHGSRFCVKDGSVVDGPATHNQPVLEVQIQGNQVLVRAQQS